MPGKNYNSVPHVPYTPGPTGVKGFSEPPPHERNYTITGVTRDNTGAPLGGCSVKLFNTATNEFSQETTSDGSGNYSFIVDKTQEWFEVAYLPGSPDVAGTTVRNVMGA